MKVNPDILNAFEEACEAEAETRPQHTAESDAMLLKYATRMTSRGLAKVFKKQFGFGSSSSIHRRYKVLTDKGIPREKIV